MIGDMTILWLFDLRWIWSYIYTSPLAMPKIARFFFTALCFVLLPRWGITFCACARNADAIVCTRGLVNSMPAVCVCLYIYRHEEEREIRCRRRWKDYVGEYFCENFKRRYRWNRSFCFRALSVLYRGNMHDLSGCECFILRISKYMKLIFMII